MRKIITKEEQEKKSKNKGLWIGIILIGIMMFGTIGYAFQSITNTDNNVKKIKYNNYEFIQNGEYWTTNINNYDLLFKYNPNEVQRINSIIYKINSYSGSPLYIYTPNEEVYYELYRNMQPFVERIQTGCLKGDDCKGVAEKTCNDNLIIVKYSDSPDIIQNNSCVFIYTPIENATMVVDEFLFKVLNIS